MKIIMHDYGGYPFTRQLAERLARRGHNIHYIYSDTTQAIKRVALHKKVNNLLETPIVLNRKFEKHSLVQRREGEIEHGKRVAEELRQFHADMILSADTPLDAQKLILKACKDQKAKFVFWMQDAIGLATREILSKKFPVAGVLVGRYYERLEQRMVRQSDAVIVISEDFMPLMKRWQVPPEKVSVIHNWAPLDEIPVWPKKNPWSVRMGLDNKFCFLFTGIIGLKHNPDLFIQLAREFRLLDGVRIVVIVEGPAVKLIKEERKKQQLENLMLLPYQPADEFDQVLGSGDVLMSVLNLEAGSYSVPSKVLSYLCAGRPLLVSIPLENLAARMVSENRAGLVCPPGESGRWLENARTLYAEPYLRKSMGENGREFAEKNFDIEQITDRFEEILVAC